MQKFKAELVSRIIEDELGISIDQMRSKDTPRNICDARLVFVGIMSSLPGFNSKKAGEFLGDRSFQDINHMRRQHRGWIETSREYQRLFERVRFAFKAKLPMLNDLELAEFESELEHQLFLTQRELVRVKVEREKRKTFNQ